MFNINLLEPLFTTPFFFLLSELADGTIRRNYYPLLPTLDFFFSSIIGHIYRTEEEECTRRVGFSTLFPILGPYVLRRLFADHL